MNRLFLAIALMAASTASMQAKVRLPHLISDGMVVQAESKVNLWGWDKPGTSVSVSVSWSDAKYTAKTAKNGRWMVKVDTPKPGYDPLSITFDDGEQTTVNGVLAGQVWVCAGQSNMEMPVYGFDFCPVEGYNDVIADAAQTKAVHHVKLPSRMSMTPLEDTDCSWQECDATGAQWTSATGYFFGRLLHKVLDQPIGLIEANKGGTAVEGWLNEANLKAHTDEPLDSATIYSREEMSRQLVWGNGTFNPVLNYTVRGIIYYQGCSNVGRSPEKYAERLALLAKQWREGFGQGEIPFYFVEIAPHDYGDVNGTSAAFLREQQHKAAELIPNSGIVCTNDCVYPWEVHQIHPCQKSKVGERLARYALSETYGKKGFVYKSPQFGSMEIKGSMVYIKLKDTTNCVYPLDGIEGFELAGEDRVFHKATAYFAWADGIAVSSPEVRYPVAVRYCWRNFQLGNVKNQGLLPLLPFRTDNW